MKETAIFLDRDGTINVEVGYLDSLEKLNVYPQAIAALNIINASGMKAIVITNQSGIARGYFTEDLVSAVHFRIQQLLNDQGAHIDAFLYCPHHPSEGLDPYRSYCLCRKPEAGMLYRAAQDLDIDLSRSYMIGDTVHDMEAAGKAGAKGVLVRTGYGKNAEHEMAASTMKPHHIADDILAAVHWIMDDRKS